MLVKADKRGSWMKKLLSGTVLKTVSRAACILLSVCFLSGCGSEKNPETGLSTGQEATTVEEVVKGENNVEQSVSDNTGEFKQPEENNVAGEDKPEENNSDKLFPMLENYREYGINLHPDIEGLGEWFCSAVLNGEGSVEWYTINMRKGEKETLIFKYTLGDDGKSWIREAVDWTQGLKGKIQEGRISVLLGEDGNYYTCYCDEGQLYHFVRQDGDSYKEIVIPDWDITSERDYRQIPMNVFVAENGNIIMSNQGYKCFIYSGEDGSLIDSFACGWYESMCVSGNELFMMKDKTNNGVLHYDLQALKQLPEIEGNFEGGVRLCVFLEDVYACCPQGVFCAKKDGGEFEKILDAGKFYFSKDNGTLLKFFMIENGFYITYGEQTGVIKKYAPRDPNEEFLGEFTVYSLEESDLIFDLVAEFKTKHPEFDVFYETGEGGEGSTTAADRIRALNARILSGDGPDVLVLDGLPAQTYIERGILADFSAVLGSDKDNIAPNILSDYMRGDALYMLPLRFMVSMFGTSGQDAAVFESLETLVDFCGGREEPAVPAGLPYPYILEILYYNFPPEIVSQDGNINEGEISKFLGLVKRFCDMEQVLPASESPYKMDAMKRNGQCYLQGFTLDWWFMVEEQEFLFINMSGDLGYFPDKVRQRGGELFDNHKRYYANGVLGINAQGAGKEWAELFVKEAFSYKMQQIDTWNTGFPVHNKLLDEYAQKDDSHSMIGAGSRDKGELYTVTGFTQAQAKEMIALARSVDNLVERNQVVYEIIEDETVSFLDGKTSLEDAAKEIANRIRLYYLE